MAKVYSVVEYYGLKESARCGYCKTASRSQFTQYRHGMWAHVLTVEDYQDLVNRNWRRSGNYCYHPVMDQTCCPAYMIKCDAKQFKLSKHQKRNIKRFNRFLMTGDVTTSDPSCDSNPSSESGAGEGTVRLDKSSTSLTPVKQVTKGKGQDPTKPKPLKAKELRLQKKEEKLQSKSAGQVSAPSPIAKTRNQEKTLVEFLEEYNNDGAKHQFELRLVRSHPASKEFLSSKEEEFKLYKRYQMSVHKDPESKLDKKQFERFLVDSPLVEGTRNDVGFGSFHYQYLLDGKIVAVEVMDILSEFISSKYFFYNPDYEFLTLGTYSTLRSIYLIQQLQAKLPTLKYYLMGYYLHACQKMRYKANFSPSYLVCPETYKWIPIEKCLPKLDANKYSRLCEDTSQEDADKPGAEDHSTTLCLFRRQIIPYGMLRCLKGGSDEEEVKEYTGLVGRTLSKRILIYRET